MTENRDNARGDAQASPLWFIKIGPCNLRRVQAATAVGLRKSAVLFALSCRKMEAAFCASVEPSFQMKGHALSWPLKQRGAFRYKKIP